MELIRDPKTGMYLTSEKGDCSGSYVPQNDYDEKAAVAEEYYMLEEHLMDLVRSYSYTLTIGWDKKYKNHKVSQILSKLFQQIFSQEFTRDQAIRYGMLLTPKEEKKEEKDVKLSATAKKLMSDLDKKQDILKTITARASLAPSTFAGADITLGQFIANAATTQGETITFAIPAPQENPETGFADNQTDF